MIEVIPVYNTFNMHVSPCISMCRQTVKCFRMFWNKSYVANVLLVKTLSPNVICTMLIFKPHLQFSIVIKLGGCLTTKWHGVNAQHYLLSCMFSCKYWNTAFNSCNVQVAVWSELKSWMWTLILISGTYTLRRRHFILHDLHFNSIWHKGRIFFPCIKTCKSDKNWLYLLV